MERTRVEITASNDGGQGEDIPLVAVVDETAAECIIPRRRWEKLEDKLHLKTTSLASEKVLKDSSGASYTVRSKSCLLIRPRDKPWTNISEIYIAENEGMQFVGGYDMLLGKSWKDKLARSGYDGRKTYGAAPTELQKGQGQARKEHDENARKHHQQKVTEAKDDETRFEKLLEEEKKKLKKP